MSWRRLSERHPRLRSFVRRRLDADRPLGLHVTLGVIFAALGICLFTLVAVYVVSQHETASLDHDVSSLLEEHAHQQPTLTDLVFAVTTLGNAEVLAGVTGLVALVLLVVIVRSRRHFALGYCWILATVGGHLVNRLLKATFQRPRPRFFRPLVFHDDWSFPSGHTMGSLVVYGMLAYLLVRAIPHRQARILIVALALLLVGLIGCSRPYLGAHWPSDVLGGWAAGGAWLALCIALAEVCRRRANGGSTSEVDEAPA